MELFPRDLGTERYLATLRRRLTPFAGTNNGVSTLTLDEAEPNQSRPRFRRVRGRRLRRYWVKDLNLDDETAEKLGGALWRGAPGINVRVGAIIVSIYLLMPTLITTAAGAPFFIPVLLLMMWALVTYAILLSPRQTIKKLHEKAITATEVETMLPNARGRLERSYLGLVLDALRTEVPSVSAQNDIRAALKDLGDTVMRLPADAVPMTDPATLRQQAQEQRAKAQAENDSFVRASLLRQAEGYERRAALSDENVVSARRQTALRREARIQMDALRAVLVAFQHTSQADASSVAHLSDAVSRVAQEAQAVSIARRELEEDEIARLFGKPLPSDLPRQPVVAPAVAPQPQTQAVGQGGAAPQPQPQVVPSRNWWRNQ
jgi:hypothetical protein